ncbi:uncharacterized protein TrAtP1_013087 [Trichoderma atroviride]|uniref:uncharacterized protein n=1 Tax=Hypocrea atroviridis TaxID=63577 RepID=UPI00331E4FC3|nr:hypothetical protein TrAtP1_013087 [Trichoderma atroviride]
MGGPITDLGLACPESGSFYICKDKPNRFVGCCTVDPCSTKDGLCPDNAVRPASFDPDAYDQILAQQCVDPGFLWYTCRDSSPPFMGCCSQMGCEDNGCPVDKVGVATLSSNAEQAAPFLSSDSSSSTTSSSTTSSSTTSSTSSTATSAASSTVSTTLSTATSTSTSTSQSAAPQQSTETPTDPPSVHKGLDKGAIGGIAVGAVAGVCILALVAFWALRRRNNNNNKQPPYAFAAGRSGKDSLARHRDRTAPSLLGGRGNAAAVEQMAELPATSSQLSISSGTTPAPRHIASLMSSPGPAGGESPIFGFSAPAQPASHIKQEQSSLIHQTTLFELEDSSSRVLKGRRQ